jgi:hypothetical protein
MYCDWANIYTLSILNTHAIISHVSGKPRKKWLPWLTLFFHPDLGLFCLTSSNYVILIMNVCAVFTHVFAITGYITCSLYWMCAHFAMFCTILNHRWHLYVRNTCIRPEFDEYMFKPYAGADPGFLGAGSQLLRLVGGGGLRICTTTLYECKYYLTVLHYIQTSAICYLWLSIKPAVLVNQLHFYFVRWVVKHLCV